VLLDTISADGIKDLVKNNSTSSGSSTSGQLGADRALQNFEFISMHRMYRDRDFEFISISADDPDRKEKALKYLQKQQASCKNYIFSETDKYKMIEAIDSSCTGALPYTLLVEPGGKIVYAKQGAVDPLK
jgi:hypothetical protein